MIRQKSERWMKCKNPEILEKWRKEASLLDAQLGIGTRTHTWTLTRPGVIVGSPPGPGGWRDAMKEIEEEMKVSCRGGRMFPQFPQEWHLAQPVELSLLELWKDQGNGTLSIWNVVPVGHLGP